MKNRLLSIFLIIINKKDGEFIGFEVKNWWENPSKEIGKIESLVHFISVEKENKNEENIDYTHHS